MESLGQFIQDLLRTEIAGVLGVNLQFVATMNSTRMLSREALHAWKDEDWSIRIFLGEIAWDNQHFELESWLQTTLWDCRYYLHPLSGQQETPVL